jgi:hypothetical protein
MDYRNRVGHFIALAGAISLFVFWTSLYTPGKNYNYLAFILGIILLWIGLPLRRAKRPAPPPPSAPPVAAPPPAPAKQSAPAPKKPGLLTTILKGPPPRTGGSQTRPAPPPAPAAPPAPPPKKGLAGLFAPKKK